MKTIKLQQIWGKNTPNRQYITSNYRMNIYMYVHEDFEI